MFLLAPYMPYGQTDVQTHSCYYNIDGFNATFEVQGSGNGALENAIF